MSPTSRWLARIGLALGSTLLALALAEVALRVRAPSGDEWLLANSPALVDRALFTRDEAGDFQLVPGHVSQVRTPEFQTVVRVSSLGTRGPEPGPKPDGGLRVLAVGDSFTLALQVPEEKTFEARLAGSLTERLGRPVDVVDAGVDNHGTGAATRQAARLVPLIGADAVLLTFFTGNDFEDNAREQRGGGRRGPPRPAEPASHLSELARRSYLWSTIAVASNARSLASDPELAQRYRRELSIFTTAGVEPGLLGATRAALGRFSTLCEDLDIACFVAIAPPAFLPHPERLDATFALAGLDPAQADLDAPAQAVVGALPAGMAHLDLAPALRTAADEPLYYTFDGHWTAHGHGVVAAALTDPLADLLAR